MKHEYFPLAILTNALATCFSCDLIEIVVAVSFVSHFNVLHDGQYQWILKAREKYRSSNV